MVVDCYFFPYVKVMSANTANPPASVTVQHVSSKDSWDIFITVIGYIFFVAFTFYSAGFIWNISVGQWKPTWKTPHWMRFSTLSDNVCGMISSKSTYPSMSMYF